MRLHCIFTQSLSFLLSFSLSIEWIWNDSWMISSHNDHDVSRRQSEHIIMLQRVYNCPIYKTCSNIHYLVILSFTWILVAVTRNKIETKEACYTLSECSFVHWKPSFFKSMIWTLCFLKSFFLNTMLFFIFQRSCLGQFYFIRKVVQRASQIQTFVKLVIKWHYFWKPRGKIKTFKRVFLLE